jgi:hypothetical protein
MMRVGVHDAAGKNPAEPRQELAFGVAAKRLELSGSTQKGLLDDVRGAGPNRKMQVNLRTGDNVEIVPIPLQQLAQTGTLASAGTVEQRTVFLLSPAGHEFTPHKRQATTRLYCGNSGITAAKFR